ncbi:Hypothetical_protein [Hexamita inflata]|uniref:Hypothetical_protein n=1 Tax=Hexamita inflata TaxID=28002 RepID=A0AA86UC32_9EUKA|nr:Hypothetical protein HINF_LOCUS39660 [Hexamita inflata]
MSWQRKHLDRRFIEIYLTFTVSISQNTYDLLHVQHLIARTYEFQYLSINIFPVKRPVTQLLMVHALHNHCRETFQNMTLNDQNSLLAYIQLHNFENDGLHRKLLDFQVLFERYSRRNQNYSAAALNMSHRTEHLHTLYACFTQILQ